MSDESDDESALTLYYDLHPVVDHGSTSWSALPYRRLFAENNEIRVLTKVWVNPRDDLVNCILEHVSLNDYTEIYAKYLGLIGDVAPNKRLPLWFDIHRRGPHETERSLSKIDLDKLYTECPGLKTLTETSRSAERYNWGDFKAVSYQWGDPNPPAYIAVNGVKLAVTRNLEQMLREFRDGEVDFALWVDALCINQQDAREKSIEIRRMRYIYSESHSVIVWLGFGSEDAVATVKLIEKVGMEDGPLHPDMSEESLPGWRGVCELARRPYWQRLWIIQEILSATPTAHMWFSGEWVEMKYFLVATSVLLVLNRARFAKLCQSTEISSPSLDHDGTLSHMKTLLFLQHYISKIEKNPYLGHVALLELLNFGAKAQQADPRDKIYGLLGLMDPRVQQEVEVDYNKPYPEVYRNFARMIVEKSGNLDIIFQQASNPSRIRQQDETELSGQTIDHDCPDLPSWTPNWLLCRTLDDHASGALGHNYAFFDAANGTRHIPQQETNVNHLTCRGLLYASVDGLGCSHNASKPHDTHDVVAPISPFKVICHYLYRYWDRARDNMWAALTLGKIKVYDEPDRDVLFRLPYFPDLIDRAETSGSPDPSWTYEGGPDDFRVLVQWQRCNRDFSLFGNPLPVYFEEANESFFRRPKEPPKDDHASLWDIRNILAQRRIATTTGGDLILVPQGARQRDVIFILRGCNAPVVLRPRDDGTWYLVGECYIHAVMQGSIMKQYMEGHKDEDVIIR